MKRISVWFTLLCMVLAIAFGASASQMGIEVDPEGYLLVELPENASIAPGTQYDAYVIKWAPVSDVYQYQVTLFQYVDSKIMNGMAIKPAMGFVSDMPIADGSGKRHELPFAIHGAIEIDGSSDHIDIAPLLNMLEADTKDLITDSCYAMITVVPISGKPIVQLYELPMT